MAYLILIIGLILFIYGFKKSYGSDKNEFRNIYEQASDQSEIKLVNHTIREDELQQDVAFLKKEVEALKKCMMGRITQPSEAASPENDNNKNLPKKENENISNEKNESYKNKNEGKTLSDEMLYQKLRESESDLSLEALSKEAKIGKGELLLLKKLSEK